MSEEWMPSISLPIAPEHFQQLPRNPAYSYDFLEGTALVLPRPKHFHGILSLARWQAPGAEPRGLLPRPIETKDQAVLPAVFAAAFDRVQPFAGLAEGPRLDAARQCLMRTWSGGDGPWLKQASFLAPHPAKDQPLGAIIITLVPGGDPARAESYRWDAASPGADAPGSPNLPGEVLERKLGQPHLTWIFVDPMWKGTGMGSALLGRAVHALRNLGYDSLWSTFLLGNDSSMLWHWRNGFELAAYPYSRRTSRGQVTR